MKSRHIAIHAVISQWHRVSPHFGQYWFLIPLIIADLFAWCCMQYMDKRRPVVVVVVVVGVVLVVVVVVVVGVVVVGVVVVVLDVASQTSNTS